MSLDRIPALDDMMETFEQVSALADFMEAANAHAPDSVTVEDPTQSLELTMLRDGTIEEFHIENDWRDRIEPEDLGDAISALIGDANTELMAASEAYLAENYEEWQEEREGHEFNSLTSPIVAQTRADASEILDRAAECRTSLDDALSEALSYVDEALAETRAFITAMEETDEQDIVGETVWCTKTAGRVTSVGVNPAWAATTPYPVLRDRILSVLAGEDDTDFDESSSAQRGEEVIALLLSQLNRSTE